MVNLAADSRELVLTPSKVNTASHPLLTPTARPHHALLTHSLDVVTTETRVETSCALETRFVCVKDG